MCLPLLCLPNIMFCISLITKTFTVVSLIIALFLLGFLLIGNVSAAPAYSSVFMVNFKFNTTADAFSEVISTNTSSIAKRSITANYMGICARLEDGKKVCSAAGNYTALDKYLSVGAQGTKISLAEIASKFTEACHPRLLIVSLMLVVLLLLTVLWCTIPLLPSKPLIRKISVGLCLLCILIWGLGSMLQHQTVASTVKLVGPSSMGMVIATKGGRAEAMTWTAFAFLLVVLGMLAKSVFQDMRQAKPKAEPEPPRDPYPMQQERYYYAEPKKYGYA
ncbi:hypothetical protein FT663_00990 [Candidozyma haemuli var. vulneris]|nr:hypothetical protein FT662_01561 [[Candida] haemuloni var. vulneris]KAF3994885.1 hypothetical protein FT663_00990 [[Candida] haemuloni var. vulneris]